MHLKSKVAFRPTLIVLQLARLDAIDVDEDVSAVGRDGQVVPVVGFVNFLFLFSIGLDQPAAAVAFVDPAQAAAGRADLDLQLVGLVRLLEDGADVEAAVAGNELELACTVKSLKVLSLNNSP